MIIEKKTEVKVFLKEALCPVCNKELQRSENVLLTYPVQYGYWCDCGYTEISTECYPKIDYEKYN